MTNKMMGIISLCRKAGKLKTGFDAVKEAIQKDEVRLVLYAGDLSEKSRDSIDWQAQQAYSPPPCRQVDLTMEELSAVCGRRAGILAITDQGLAQAVDKLLKQSNEEESNL